jgi:hypothetical protein
MLPGGAAKPRSSRSSLITRWRKSGWLVGEASGMDAFSAGAFYCINSDMNSYACQLSRSARAASGAQALGQGAPSSLFLRYDGGMSLKLYLVSCDLLHEGDYASLKARLRTFEARQVLDNQWALHSTHTAAELKEILRQFLDERDRIVVTEVGAERASRRALCNLLEL